MTIGVLIPAYGRDYKSKKLVEQDFRDGKDFIFLNPASPDHGKYMSIRDLEEGQSVEVRYDSKTKLVILKA